MNDYRYVFRHVPTSPLGRFGLALLGIAILVVSFFVGLVFVAIVAGLAILGGLGLTIRNWLVGRKAPSKADEDLIEVEYRVVHRDRNGDR